MLKQLWLKLLPKYWLVHTTRTITEIGLGAVLVGTAGAVVTVTPLVNHPHSSPKPTAVAVIPKPISKPVVKPSAQPTTPATTPAPTTATAPASAPSKQTATPAPIAPTQPSPGSGVKKLVATPPPASPTPSQTSDPSTTSTSSSSSTTSSTTSTTSGTTTTSTAATAPAPATGGYYSTNWAGYAALSGKFTAVSGSWTVPAVTGNGTTATSDAAWIGIGGVSSNDLIQTGTSNQVDADGTVSTFVFYEMLPDPALEVTGFAVKTGDAMTASISQLPSGKWQISITNTTTGQSYTTSTAYTSSYSSAEWIEEDPSYLDGSLVPFDRFTHVEFGDGNTTMNGLTMTVGTSGASPITLVDSHDTPIVTPSVLINAGTGFWATYNQ